MKKPKIVMVDENDNVIGAKYRDELDYSRDIYRVTGIWITNSKGEVLIAQRAFTKSHDPGKWGPAVAGTVEEGETYEMNATKEAEEELGLVGITLALGPKLFTPSSKRHFGQWFFCTVDKAIDEFIVQKDEVEGIKWVDEKALFQDVKNNPDRYIPSLPRRIELLKEN